MQAASKKAKHGQRGNATAILLCSDFHYSAVVNPSEVDHCNKYNIEIAEARIKRLWHKTVEIIDFVNNLCRVDDLLVWLGGDLLNGSLFRQELEAENELGPMSEMLAVQDICATGLTFLRQQTKLPIRVVTSHGNHARTEKLKRAAGAWDHNLEYTVYKNVERAFAKDDWISFQVGRGIQNWVDVRGFSLCFQHGDGIKYQGGVGGLHIPLRRAIGRWNQRRNAHLYCLGHYHQYIDDWRYVVNGSVVGYDSFAMSIAADYQPPTQTLLIVGPPYGKLLSIPLWIADKEPFPYN